MFLVVAPSKAAAAPAFDLTAKASPPRVAAGAEGRLRLNVRNSGDAEIVTNAATITATLPPGLKATGASSLASAWNCSVAVGGASVTCTGPTQLIPADSHLCFSFITFSSEPCDVYVEYEVAPGTPTGTIFAADFSVCGGGASSCPAVADTAGALVEVGDPRPYGGDYGLAPVNDGPAGPDPEAPAFPGESAFWAGACERHAAPAPGPAPIPGGVGTRPEQVLVPVEKGSSEVQDVAPAPTVPDHCIDTGAPALYEAQEEIWQTLPWVGGELGLTQKQSTPVPCGQPSCSFAPSWRLPAQDQAGSHPDGTTSFAWARNPDEEGGGAGLIDGSVDNIHVDLPPGFVGNPKAVPACAYEDFSASPLNCPPQTQIGVIRLDLQAVNLGTLANLPGSDDRIYPVYNLEPRAGRTAEFGFAPPAGAVPVRLTGKARTNGDFGISAFTGQVPAALVPVMQTITVWGVPWAAENDAWRAPQGGNIFNVSLSCQQSPGTSFTASNIIPPGGLKPECQTGYEPSWGEIEPFFSGQTECSGESPTVTLRTDSYQYPGAFTAEGDPDPADPDWKTYTADSPPVSGCEKLGFEPSIALDPTGQGGVAVQSTDSPSGLDVELAVPQNNDLPFDRPAQGAPQVDVDQYVADAGAFWRSDQGLATAHLRDSTVTLPAGMTLNPAAASGQAACSMAEIGVADLDSPEPPKLRFDNQPVACPDASKVGEVVVETPLLDEADWPRGSVYLARQGDNPFGSDFAIYAAVESPERGLIVKLAGKVQPDPVTGQLTTTVVENPQLPFDTFRLEFKGGPRAPLATPTTCGTHTSINSFTPYSAPDSPVTVDDPFPITSSPAGGCPATPAERPFNLGFSAGSTDIVAGSHSGFTARFTRPDGNQELDRIELTTPEGLAAKLAGVPYCSESGIAQAQGRTATGDGALEKASPSCPASSRVGTTTIGAGAGSQPFFVKGDVYLAGPYKGAPVSMAFIVPAVAGPFDLGVQVVRTALQVNPKTAQVTAVSDTIPKMLRGIPLRIRDVRVDVDRSSFIVNPTDCSEQRVTGKVYGASGGSTEVSNRFQIAECARLGFKPSLSLKLKGGTKRAKYQGLTAVVTPRPGDANIAATSVTMPRSAFLAQEHIRTVCTRVQFAADTCPAGSIYGKAKAWSPLLDEPLSGNVYLRSSSNKLPDLVTDLRGPASQPIRVELAGRTDSFKGALRNTFDIVPDAPVTKFELQLFGGQKGLIVNSQDLCKKKRHLATVKMTAQNGREHNFRPVVKNGCRKIKKAGKKAKQGKRR